MNISVTIVKNKIGSNNFGCVLTQSAYLVKPIFTGLYSISFFQKSLNWETPGVSDMIAENRTYST